MDFSKNVVLKENFTFLVADSDGRVTGGEHGVYNRDTRFLSSYRWTFRPDLQTLLLDSQRPDRLEAHLSYLGHHQQHLAVRRRLQLSTRGLDDKLNVEVTGGAPQQLELELEFDSDFADLFEVRGWDRIERQVEREHGRAVSGLAYRGGDGKRMAVEISFSSPPQEASPGRARFVFSLRPGERRELEVSVRLINPLETWAGEGLEYQEWRSRFRALELPEHRVEVASRAIDDLRALLLFDDGAVLPAAGIPWFVAAFGRDALLTAALVLPQAADLAEGTLRYLAKHQGRRHDEFRAEAPGKIMHELRFGELTRLGRTPHSPYYGTVDATPLFVVLLGRLFDATGQVELVRELRPQWEAALGWMEQDGDLDGDGFLEFTAAAPGKGLVVQSWKDSPDSMSHADGSLAVGPVAASEVQGYAFEAYRTAAGFYEALGEATAATLWQGRAATLQERFQQAFWREDMGTYAMALDGEKRPLAVQNSNAGHLLWNGIVPPGNAGRLVETLFSEANWSGWGFRTLGSDEARYNPVSYHNGSVWPHDSAIIAHGLARYGFAAEARVVREALLDLAASQPDRRLPELVAGYRREAGSGGIGDRGRPPIPYPVACRPQAWDAAAVLSLLTLA